MKIISSKLNFKVQHLQIKATIQVEQLRAEFVFQLPWWDIFRSHRTNQCRWGKHLPLDMDLQVQCAFISSLSKSSWYPPLFWWLETSLCFAWCSDPIYFGLFMRQLLILTKGIAPPPVTLLPNHEGYYSSFQTTPQNLLAICINWSSPLWIIQVHIKSSMKCIMSCSISTGSCDAGGLRPEDVQIKVFWENNNRWTNGWWNKVVHR